MRITTKAFYAPAWLFAYSLLGYASYTALNGNLVSVDNFSGAFN